jgi:hypothetical protein
MRYRQEHSNPTGLPPATTLREDDMKTTAQTSKLTLTICAMVLLFGAIAAAAAERTPIVAADDWPWDSYLDLGELKCPGGEIVVEPLTGFPTCSAGSRVHFRNTLAYSCVQAVTETGEPEPRLSGVLFSTFTANWDASYGGAVWGSWRLVPTESCGPLAAADSEIYWVGTLRGQRTPVCNDSGQCWWVGNLKLVGRGRGGDLAGLHFKGTEMIVTHSPVPLPYELLAILGLCQPGSCPVGAEGHLMGTIR